jgi:hypothetical protein
MNVTRHGASKILVFCILLILALRRAASAFKTCCTMHGGVVFLINDCYPTWGVKNISFLYFTNLGAPSRRLGVQNLIRGTRCGAATKD